MKIRNLVISGIVVCAMLLMSTVVSAQVGNILDRLGKGKQDSLGNDKIVSGLKEALQVGAGNAVSLTGKTDGYFRNEAIKILLPEKVRSLEKGLRAAGLGKNIDDFELSMNRAAEKAAPEAKGIFLDAIRGMTLDDGRKILTGGNTAATDYFKGKTSASLTTAFRPIVEKAMEDTEVTRRYNQLMGGLPMGGLANLPFGAKDSFDITDYVVSKSLDGLFYVLGEEERKIRTDPAARVTGLLKEVFGR